MAPLGTEVPDLYFLHWEQEMDHMEREKEKRALTLELTGRPCASLYCVAIFHHRCTVGPCTASAQHKRQLGKECRKGGCLTP